MNIRIPAQEVELDNKTLWRILREVMREEMLTSIHYKRGRLTLDVTLFCDLGRGKPHEVTRSYPLWPMLRDNTINEWIDDKEENERAWKAMQRVAKKFNRLTTPGAYAKWKAKQRNNGSL